MRVYRSFLVRCWMTPSSSEDERCLFEIKNVQTGEQARAHSVRGVQRLMEQACEKARLEPPVIVEEEKDITDQPQPTAPVYLNN